MASNGNSRNNLSVVSLAVLAGALFVLGAGSARAPAPEPVCVPEARADLEEAAPEPLNADQRALVAYLSRRFMVAGEALSPIVAAADRAAREVGLDPLLVLAVIAVESRFNPFAQSGMGAKGLMQIIPRFHGARFKELGGEEAVLDPESNILVGARILQEYVHRTGTLEAGLQFYNGAMRDDSAQYAQKVLAERARLELALRAARGVQRRAAAAYTRGG